MRRFRLHALVGVAFFAMLAAACDVPLINAPPGGGAAQTQSFLIGPFNVAADGSVSGYRVGVPRPNGSFGLKTAQFTLVDENGDEIARHDAHLHHILLVDPDTPDVLCPSRGERFAGSGQERTPISIRDPYAYMVASGERIDALYEVMNMMSEPMTVYIKYTLGYQPGATTENTRPAVPYFLDVTGCGNSEYNVPGNGDPGSVHVQTRTWTAPADGIAVGAGGHQHAGGLGLTLRHVQTGIVGCQSDPIYDPMDMEGHPMAMTTCTMHKPVKAGDQYRLESRYDNSMPRSGVMGIMLAYVWHGTQ